MSSQHIFSYKQATFSYGESTLLLLQDFNVVCNIILVVRNVMIPKNPDQTDLQVLGDLPPGKIQEIQSPVPFKNMHAFEIQHYSKQVQLKVFNHESPRDDQDATQRNKNQSTTEGQGRPRYKSSSMSIIIGLIISLSGFNYGYSLAACSVVNITQIKQIYGINLSQSATSALLIGLMPAGGIFGAAFNQVFVKYFNRKYSIFVMCSILWLGLALMLIHNPYTIYIGRFIQGFAVALYLSISPIYLKQVTAKQLRPRIMTMFGLMKAFGAVFANILQNIFLAADYKSTSYIVLLTFNGYIAIIQVVLYLFFVPHSPLQLVAKQKYDRAKKELLIIYNQQYLEEALTQYIQEHQKSKTKKKDQKEFDISQNSMEVIAFKKKVKKAFITGTFVVLIRQLSGANCVTTFSSKIIAAFNPSISSYMSLILNAITFVSNLISVIFITKRFGRRRILLFGIGCMCLFSLAIAISLIEQVEVAILLFMSIYMALYGANILTICYSYPSEVMAPQMAVYPNILNWIALTLVTSVPPIIVGAMPDNNAYPLFFFFGGYGIIATIVVYFMMRQSKGLTYKQIIESF